MTIPLLGSLTGAGSSAFTSQLQSIVSQLTEELMKLVTQGQQQMLGSMGSGFGDLGNLGNLGNLGSLGGANATNASYNADTSLSGGSSRYDDLIQRASRKYGVPAALIKAVMKQESGFDPGVVSPAGAVGLMQLLPSTAGKSVAQLKDPATNIDAGTKYLKEQLDAFGGNVRLALAAYNAGPNAVRRYGGVPPYSETQHYVSVVSQNYQQYSGNRADYSLAA